MEEKVIEQKEEIKKEDNVKFNDMIDSKINEMVLKMFEEKQVELKSLIEKRFENNEKKLVKGKLTNEF